MKSYLATFLHPVGLLAILAANAPRPASAESPQVCFDAAPLVVCRDITSSEFASQNSTVRLVEARFTISALVRKGAAEDLAEMQFTFSTPEETMHVVDFAPRTTLSTDIFGAIQFENKDENNRDAGLDLGAEYEMLTAKAKLADNQKHASVVKFQKLPALDLVAASGTFDRERAVFFRLRSSSRASLEGTHEFRLTLCVPNTWRGDYLQLRCMATTKKNHGNSANGENQQAGGARLLVALCQQGDSQALAKAKRLATLEQQLRRVAASERAAIEKASYTNDLQRFARIFDAAQSKIPADWLARVLYGPVGSDSGNWMNRMPSEVVEAAAAFTTAKLELRDLSGR